MVNESVWSVPCGIVMLSVPGNITGLNKVPKQHQRRWRRLKCRTKCHRRVAKVGMLHRRQWNDLVATVADVVMLGSPTKIVALWLFWMDTAVSLFTC